MSRLLIDEPPLQVLPSLAAAIGLNEAIFLQQLHYWLNPKSGDPHYKEYEGVVRPWIYNTYDVKITKNGKETGWKANYPFWSVRTIKRIVTNLKAKGLIIVTDKFNDSPTNRTQWYTIDYDIYNAIGGTVESDKVARSKGQIGTVMTVPDWHGHDRDYQEKTSENIPLEKKSSGLSLKTQTDTTPSLVSVFDSDVNVIPGMQDILIKMSDDKLVDYRPCQDNPDWDWYHWIDNGQPVKAIPYGIAKKYGYKPPERVLVDTKAPYVVDEQTQSGLPVPDTLAEYAADLARSTAETLDAEIMGMGDELTDVFGPNGRQAEIDTYQAKERQPLTPDELLLGAMVGPVSAAVRSKLTQMRSQGWKVADSEIEILLAQFFEITGFVLPTSKSRRKFFEAGVREHMQEELFSGRIEELYETVWDKISTDVAAGDLEITSPKSLTSFMYGILNREEGPVSELTRAQLIDRLTNDNLVEVKEINGAVGFVWVETGKLVGEIPTEIVARYSRAGSSN